ncbi:Ribonuclease H domain-containing protein [Cinnamomum micranthum f. kanehirae]|uniref:cellulase n=1 Tax=Cinnamomum micranthum f. kanehirae TaxID=337451 RepID=A0A3S3N1E3_9MAGN|nr:Ribonuclease H domain-containing protein [Cinnamomum micranthum f. kanehirae]
MHRRSLWQSLIARSRNVSKPWIVAGDFNTIRWVLEKSEGSIPRAAGLIEFNDCIQEAGLVDLPLQGSPFTWSNSSIGATRIESKLDRVLVNATFLQTHPFKGEVLMPGISDHCPLLLSIHEKPNIKAPFRYFNYWVKMPGFFDMAQNAWNNDVCGTPLYRVVQKLQMVKQQLIEWHHAQSSLSNRLLAATAHLNSIHSSLVGDPTNVNLQEEERMARYHLDHILLVKESMYKQRSRDMAVNLGDSNTKYFYRLMPDNTTSRRPKCDPGVLVLPTAFEVDCVSLFSLPSTGANTRSPISLPLCPLPRHQQIIAWKGQSAPASQPSTTAPEPLPVTKRQPPAFLPSATAQPYNSAPPPLPPNQSHRPAFVCKLCDFPSTLCQLQKTLLLAASLVFRRSDPSYSKLLLKTAIRDELLWGATWLHKATKNPTYLNYIQANVQTLGANETDNTFGWDIKHVGARILLSKESWTFCRRTFLCRRIGRRCNALAIVQGYADAIKIVSAMDLDTYGCRRAVDALKCIRKSFVDVEPTFPDAVTALAKLYFVVVAL